MFNTIFRQTKVFKKHVGNSWHTGLLSTEKNRCQISGKSQMYYVICIDYKFTYVTRFCLCKRIWRVNTKIGFKCRFHSPKNALLL